jgi:DNA repair protein RecO (recombination protein O)
MITHTQAIVLRLHPYSDTSLIVKTYSEQFGPLSFIVPGVRSAKSRAKAALYRPPNLLDLVIYYKEDRDLHRIREAQLAVVYKNLPFDIRRSSVGLFMAEIVSRCLQEQESQPDIFEFIFRSFKQLDEEKELLAFYPLLFLVQLSKQIGIFPQGSWSAENSWFDLREARFCPSRPAHNQFMDQQNAALFYDLCSGQLSQEGLRSDRRHLLEQILKYYEIHVPGLGKIQSARILAEVLR